MIKLDLTKFGGSGSGSGLGGYRPSWKIAKEEAQSKGIIGRAADKVKEILRKEPANPNIVTKIDKSATYDRYKIENGKEVFKGRETGEDISELLRGYKPDKNGIWRKNGKEFRLKRIR